MKDVNIERNLQKKIEDLAKFPDMNPGPVLRVSPEGEVLLANKGARDIFREERILGKNWIEECPDLNPRIWTEILKSDKSFGFKINLVGFYWD